MNTDLTKLARWVVPGWVLFFAFYLFTLIDTATCNYLRAIATHGAEIAPHVICLYPSIQAALHSLSSLSPIMLTIMLTALAIPTGLLIYQGYFYIRWNSPASRDGMTALSPGRWLDLRQTLRELDSEDGKQLLSLGQEWRKKVLQHPLYDIEHNFRARYLDTLFLECKDEHIFKRMYYLHEVTHVLGGSLGAIYLAFAAYMLLKLDRGIMLIPSSYLLFAGLSVLALAFIMERETREIDSGRLKTEFTSAQREDLQKKLAPLSFIRIGALVVPYPSAFFVIAWAYVIGAASPFFDLPLEIQKGSIICLGLPISVRIAEAFLRSLILLFFAIAWVWASPDSLKTPSPRPTEAEQERAQEDVERDDKPTVKAGPLAQGLISILLAGLVSALQHFTKHNSASYGVTDWPFINALFVLLLFSLLLYRNRHNAKNDLLYLKYYALHKIIQRSEAPPKSTTQQEA